MKDLKHLIYFESLLENADNELVKQAQAEGGFLSSILGMAPMILIIVVMFYLMYRSQKKEPDDQEAQRC